MKHSTYRAQKLVGFAAVADGWMDRAPRWGGRELGFDPSPGWIPFLVNEARNMKHETWTTRNSMNSETWNMKHSTYRAQKLVGLAAVAGGWMDRALSWGGRGLGFDPSPGWIPFLVNEAWNMKHETWTTRNFMNSETWNMKHSTYRVQKLVGFAAVAVGWMDRALSWGGRGLGIDPSPGWIPFLVNETWNMNDQKLHD